MVIASLILLAISSLHGSVASRPANHPYYSPWVSGAGDAILKQGHLSSSLYFQKSQFGSGCRVGISAWILKKAHDSRDGKKSETVRRMALDLEKLIDCDDIGLVGNVENCFFENEECLFPPLMQPTILEKVFSKCFLYFTFHDADIT